MRYAQSLNVLKYSEGINPGYGITKGRYLMDRKQQKMHLILNKFLDTRIHTTIHRVRSGPVHYFRGD